MHGGPVPAHQDDQVVPETGPVIDDYIPESPLVGLDMSIESLFTCSSNPFTKEPIETSATASGLPSVVKQIFPSGTTFVGDSNDDLNFEDNDDLEMDTEIVDLTSDSD
ncbi:hypothetical protein AHAS_Ahas15G0250600 [Arachis hypogaea]